MPHKTLPAAIKNQQLDEIVATTLLGEYHFRQPWFQLCASTWHLANLKNPINIINDGSLQPSSLAELSSKGFNLIKASESKFLVEDRLGKYPALSELRSKNNLFKKIIDTSIIFADKKILFIDSDVIFRSSFLLPENPPSFLFCIDEVPGYGGSWQIPLRYPIVTGLNSGFVYYEPRLIDFSFLDFVAGKFLANTQKTWWLEQTCWALIAGSAESKGIFDGKDACVISGLFKRTPLELKENKTFYFRRTTRTLSSQEVDALVDDAVVVHCAGPAKPWIKNFYEKKIISKNHQVPRTLNWLPISNADWQEKIALSLRMRITG